MVDKEARQMKGKQRAGAGEIPPPRIVSLLTTGTLSVDPGHKHDPDHNPYHDRHPDPDAASGL
jgi:hypothetical protein